MNGKKWIKIWFILIFIIGVIPYSLLYIYLESNFENNTYSDIVERQITNNSIYGTALNQNTFSYKLELIKKVKPNIVALGSSRVMAFRKENFNTSFVTAGGAMNFLNEGYKFLENMYQFHKPEYIILGLDFWWFNNDFYQPKYFPYHGNNGNNIGATKIYKTLSWLASGKISLSSTNILNSNKNKFTNYDNLGFNAISTSDGFRSDGSHFYSKLVFGLEKSEDEKFSNTFNRINNGNNRFEYGNELSKDRVDMFYKILEIIKKNNTKIILLIPPIANATYKKMEAYPYDFIDRFRELVKSLDMENYDYHNLSVITQNDCECVDGFHGGDVVYSRIIKDIYDKNSSISKYIDIANVNNSINLYQGNALIVNSDNIFRNQEVDFLQLGCIKQKNKLNVP
jgi:hypothetical protein